MNLTPIGTVRSPLTDRSTAPRQGDADAPEASIVLTEAVRAGLDGVAVGDELVVVTWLHEADRGVLRVRPRRDPERREVGVFATRSPDRPNPIGLHPVTVVAIDGLALRVRGLEAIDGTPVVDLKPTLDRTDER